MDEPPINAIDSTEFGLLPKSWTLRPLGGLVHRPQYGVTAIAIEKPIGPKFLRITDIQDDQVNWSTVPYCQCDSDALEKCRLASGDLVIARIGATTGKSFLVTKPAESVFASYLIRLRTTSEMVPDFLNFFTKSRRYWTQIDATKGGRLKQGVNIHSLQNLMVPVPPLAEQQAIVHVLRTVQHAKEVTTKVIAAARQLKASLIRHLFTYGAVPFGQAERIPLKKSPFGFCPEKWPVRAFGDVVTITSGQVDPRQLPYLKMLHVGPENIEEGTGRILNPQIAGGLRLISGKYLFGATDVLYSKIRPYLRKAALPDFEGICSADMYPMQGRNGLQREFLFCWLLSDVFTQQAVSCQLRTGIPKINRQQLEATFIPVPSGDEQQEISKILRRCDEKINAEERRLGGLGVVFNTLLQNLMTGRLRVNHLVDPPSLNGRAE